MEYRKTPKIKMRIVNGKLMDDAVDEPEDYCEDCGEPGHACWCNDPKSVKEYERDMQMAREQRQVTDAINNRPQDGRVCDCEDAPCCGHYEP